MTANKNGQYAEYVVAAALRGARCEFDRQVVIGRTIYGHAWRADFLIRNLADYPRGLVVESKWQSRDGSIDEKFPYLLDNVQRCCPYPAIIVIHGGRARQGAIEWLRARCDPNHLVAVFNLEEFMAWLLHHARVEISVP